MKAVLVDERISEKCLRRLSVLGFKTITMPPSPSLGTAVSSHPDMLLFYHCGNIITSADYCDFAPYVFSDLRELAPSVKITFTADSFSPSYPNDSIFNALAVGNTLFAKTDTVSRAVLSYAERAGLTVTHVNQGYPACTALTFGTSAITADRGMADALSREGYNVTVISNGDIALPPYEYGFIGGASGVLDDKVYFAGDITLHRDGEKIVDAIKRAGYLPVSLSDEPLMDVGRLIFLP